MNQYLPYLPWIIAIVVALAVLLLWFNVVVPQIEVLQTPVGWLLAVVAAVLTGWKLRQWLKTRDEENDSY